MPILTITDPRDLSDRQALLLVLERLQTMTQIASDTAAAVAALDSKVDTLITTVTPVLQTLRDALAAAQAQVAALQADAAADTTLLQETIAAAQSETDKVQAALDALNPAPPPPSP